MRKIAHIIKLDQVVFIKTDGGLLRVLNLYIDEDGAECGGLVMYEDGKVMSCDSNIWDEFNEYQDENGEWKSNWPFVPKDILREDKLDKILK